MSPIHRNRQVTARAALSSYLVLSGVWFLFSIGYEFLALSRRGSGLHAIGILTFAIGVLWVLWLRGFLEYRDGLYRSTSVPLKEITEAKNTWIEWNVIGRHLRVPRLVICYGNRNQRVLVNAKPFKKDDLRRVLSGLNAT
jgi:hypothetical protein